MEHLGQLAPRACLLCEGTAFEKVVRLDPGKLKVQSLDGIKLVVTTLGGVWGQSKTEHKYERFERALFGTIQKSDETHTSYIARHEVQYEDLLSLGATLEEMRAYILLRNSGLSPEDKKRVIIDANGNLQYKKVIGAIQLLGSRFFNEVQSGSNRAAGRVKTYDINFVDDVVEPEMTDHGETAYFSAEAWEDYAFETLAQEGDEDCLVMQQFEDALVESLQGDAEVASCLNAYVEARQRLLEKSKSRGFWSGRSQKGKSKGKSKGSFGQRFRQPLAQRILNSTCRICGARGHWKAECPNNPMRDQSKTTTSGNNPLGSRSTAFAGMTMAETVELNIEDEEVPPENAVAFTVQATSTLVRQSFLNRMPSRIHPKIQCKDQVCGVNENMPLLNFQSVLHRFRTLIRPTTSEKDDTTRIGKTDPLIQEVTRNEQPDESVLFASQGTFGIVDLGASLSVIGKHQFEELCQSLPPQILSGMKEAPCAVNFGFGNDSTVIGDRAVYFPVQQYWIKVVVVPSNTPFLIANSVFRSLGAVIDTEDNTVFFKKLHRRIPITLTDRKLYRLDFAELLTGPEPSSEQNQGPEWVCQTTTESKEFDKQVTINESNQKVDNETPLIEERKDKPGPLDRTSLITEPVSTETSVNSLKPDSWFESPHTGDRSCVDRESQHVAEPIRHVGRSSPPIVTDRDPREGQARGDHEHDLCRVERPSHGLRQGSCGKEVQRDGVQHQVCHLVRRELQGQSETDSPQVSSICVPSCRTSGTQSREGQDQVGSSEQSHAQDSSCATGQRDLSCPRSNCGVERVRELRGGGLGSSAGGQQSGVTPDARSPSADGECHGSGTEPPEQIRERANSST